MQSMKTNTNRIRSNRSAARPSPQVKIAGASARQTQSGTTAINNLDIRDAVDLLHAAKAESAALHMLLFDAMSNREDGGRYGEEIEFEITQLICGSHENMQLAVESVEAFLASKTEVAA